LSFKLDAKTWNDENEYCRDTYTEGSLAKLDTCSVYQAATDFIYDNSN